MLPLSAACSSHFVDHDSFRMQEAVDKTVPWQTRFESLIVYNGHAGLGANLVGGIVTDNKDPDGSYRQESVGAGAREAFSSLPEVGDEVWVAFEQGDLRRPCVIGSLWNSDDKPPASDAAHSTLPPLGFKSLSGLDSETEAVEFAHALQT